MNYNNKTKCPAREDLIASLVDNEGNTGHIESIQEHVRSCPECSSLVGGFNTTSELMRSSRPEPVHLSPSFTAQVMDEVYGVEYRGLLDDILIVGRKIVTACAVMVFILLAVMIFPDDAAIDVVSMDEFIPINNGVESEVLEKDEITYDDVVSLTFSER